LKLTLADADAMEALGAQLARSITPGIITLAVVYHLDLYRLADPEELEWLGLRDMLAERALLLVEWPERGNGILPAADLTINIDYSGSGREACLMPLTEAGKHLLAQIKPET